MNPSPEQPLYQVQIEIRHWLLIDATMDNEVNTEAEDGDPRGVVQLGSSIRQAGWDQIPDWPNNAEGFEGWPPPGKTAAITLTGPQWDLVLSALDCWADASAGLGGRPEPTGVEGQENLPQLLYAQLTAQGWSSR